MSNCSNRKSFVDPGRYFKYIALLAILAICTAFLAACGSSSSSSTSGSSSSGNKGPFLIGVSNGFVDSEWRSQMISDLQSANAQYMKQGLTKDLVIVSSDVDVQGQAQQIRNLINRGVNAIIVDPNSPSALNPVIKEATDKGIVVISVDQEVTAPSAVNVVINQTDWAKISMQWLAQQLNGKGNIVIINGIAGAPANEARYNGVKQVLSQYPNIKVLNVVNANWDEATGQQKMAAILASQPNIDGIWWQLSWLHSPTSTESGPRTVWRRAHCRRSSQPIQVSGQSWSARLAWDTCSSGARSCRPVPTSLLSA